MHLLSKKRFCTSGSVLHFLARIIPCLLLTVSVAQGVDNSIEKQGDSKAVMRLVEILNRDMRNTPITFPANVSAEADQQEIYVINGGKGEILIYDKNFFPHFVLGSGRGIDSPQCVFFDERQSRIFIGQHASGDKPARLTILNAAFLPEQEITFIHLDKNRDFTPANGMVTANGKIYLTGTMSRAVLVLNNDASFSHWLEIKDKIIINKVKVTDSTATRLQHLDQIQQDKPAPEAVDTFNALPEALRPKTKNTLPRSTGNSGGMEPVIVQDMATNTEGHLFFLSEETSKIYVYNPGEKFLFSFGEKGGSSNKLSRPRGLALDENKRCIYVVDYMRHTILVYNMAGHFLFEFGGRGEKPLWFNFPTAIEVDSRGRIIIADLFNNRIQILESDFKTSYPVFGSTRGIKIKKDPNFAK